MMFIYIYEILRTKLRNIAINALGFRTRDKRVLIIEALVEKVDFDLNPKK